MTAAEAIIKAAEALGKADAVRATIEPAVEDILNVVKRLKREQGVDILDLLNGDPVHDRTVIAAAALEGELTAATDWSAVADSAFAAAWTILGTALKLIVLL